MPIINGQYQAQPINADGFNFTEQAFGSYTPNYKDMGDVNTAALNYLIHQQDQAYALDAWRLQNQYNSPSAQMQRYKEAGLNPNLVYSQQQASGSWSSPGGVTVSGTHGYSQKMMDNAMSVIQQLQQMVKTASDVSATLSQNNLRTSQLMKTNQEGALTSQKLMQQMYLNGTAGNEPDSSMYQSPYAQLQRSQLDANRAKYEQLKAATSMIPDEQERKRALTELEKYRLQIMKGQNDAILNIHTGNEGLDSFFKLISYFLLSQKL